MNNDNKLIPHYRFPEFKDDGNWQISPISDKIDYERPDKYIVKNTNYINKGTPVLTANKSFVLGYTDENDGVYRDYLPVIIFDDFTVDKKFVDFPFKVKSSAIKILKNISEEDSLKFFYELMTQIKFEAKEHKRYYISAYQKIEVPVPKNPAEQRKIAACLSSLDDVIAGHEKKLAELEEHKKGLMQNLFPQVGEKQPKFRFPEFDNDGDWMDECIGNYIDLFSGIAIKSEDITDDKNGTPILRGINITEGYIRHSEDIDRYYLGPIQPMKKYLTKVNDIVIGMDGSKVGKNVARITNKDENSILIQRVACIRNNKKSDNKYLYQQFVSSRFIKYVDNVNTSSGIPHISAQQIKDFRIMIPPVIKEQEKIAEVLSSVDDLIVGQRDKIEALKEHKKGLMQGLFPKIES